MKIIIKKWGSSKIFYLLLFLFNFIGTNNNKFFSSQISISEFDITQLLGGVNISSEKNIQKIISESFVNIMSSNFSSTQQKKIISIKEFNDTFIEQVLKNIFQINIDLSNCSNDYKNNIQPIKDLIQSILYCNIPWDDEAKTIEFLKKVLLIMNIDVNSENFSHESILNNNIPNMRMQPNFYIIEKMLNEILIYQKIYGKINEEIKKKIQDLNIASITPHILMQDFQDGLYLFISNIVNDDPSVNGLDCDDMKKVINEFLNIIYGKKGINLNLNSEQKKIIHEIILHFKNNYLHYSMNNISQSINNLRDYFRNNIGTIQLETYLKDNMNVTTAILKNNGKTVESDILEIMNMNIIELMSQKKKNFLLSELDEWIIKVNTLFRSWVNAGAMPSVNVIVYDATNPIDNDKKQKILNFINSIFQKLFYKEVDLTKNKLLDIKKTPNYQALLNNEREKIKQFIHDTKSQYYIENTEMIKKQNDILNVIVKTLKDLNKFQLTDNQIKVRILSQLQSTLTQNPTLNLSNLSSGNTELESIIESIFKDNKDLSLDVTQISKIKTQHLKNFGNLIKNFGYINRDIEINIPRSNKKIYINANTLNIAFSIKIESIIKKLSKSTDDEDDQLEIIMEKSETINTETEEIKRFFDQQWEKNINVRNDFTNIIDEQQYSKRDWWLIINSSNTNNTAIQIKNKLLMLKINDQEKSQIIQEIITLIGRKKNEAAKQQKQVVDDMIENNPTEPIQSSAQGMIQRMMQMAQNLSNVITPTIAPTVTSNTQNNSPKISDNIIENNNSKIYSTSPDLADYLNISEKKKEMIRNKPEIFINDAEENDKKNVKAQSISNSITSGITAIKNLFTPSNNEEAINPYQLIEVAVSANQSKWGNKDLSLYTDKSIIQNFNLKEDNVMICKLQQIRLETNFFQFNKYLKNFLEDIEILIKNEYTKKNFNLITFTTIKDELENYNQEIKEILDDIYIDCSNDNKKLIAQKLAKKINNTLNKIKSCIDIIHKQKLKDMNQDYYCFIKKISLSFNLFYDIQYNYDSPELTTIADSALYGFDSEKCKNYDGFFDDFFLNKFSKEYSSDYFIDNDYDSSRYIINEDYSEPPAPNVEKKKNDKLKYIFGVVALGGICTINIIINQSKKKKKYSSQNIYDNIPNQTKKN